MDLDMKFGKLFDGFESCDKDLEFEYDMDGEEGVFYGDEEVLDYSEVVGEETVVIFNVVASKVEKVIRGDWESPDEVEVVREEIVVEIESVVYLGDKLELKMWQEDVLKKLIKENLQI